MRKIQSKASGTRQKILVVAEELIVEQGFEPTSIRDIIERAKVNLAAVHYHFGSRNGLIDAALTERFEKMLETQDALLATLEAKNSRKKTSVSSAIDVWLACFSWLETMPEKEAIRVLRLLARLLQAQQGDLPERADLISQQWDRQLKRALQAILPQASEQIIRERCIWIRGGMAALLLGCEVSTANEIRDLLCSLRRLLQASVSDVLLDNDGPSIAEENSNQQHFLF